MKAPQPPRSWSLSSLLLGSVPERAPSARVRVSSPHSPVNSVSLTAFLVRLSLMLLTGCRLLRRPFLSLLKNPAKAGIRMMEDYMHQATNQRRLPVIPELPQCFAKLHSANAVECTGRRGLQTACDFNQVCREMTQLQKKADKLVVKTTVIALKSARLRSQLEA